MVFTDFLKTEVTSLDEKIRRTYSKTSQFNSSLYPSHSAPNLFQLNENGKAKDSFAGDTSFLPPLSVNSGSNGILYQENIEPKEKEEKIENEKLVKEDEDEEYEEDEEDSETYSEQQYSTERNISTLGLMNNMRKEMHLRNMGKYGDPKHKYDHMFPDLAAMKTPPRNVAVRQQRENEQEAKARKEKEEFLKIKNEILKEFYKKPQTDKPVEEQQPPQPTHPQVPKDYEHIQVIGNKELKKSPRSILNEYKRLQQEVKYDKQFNDTQRLYQTGVLSKNYQHKNDSQDSFRFNANLDLSNTCNDHSGIEKNKSLDGEQKNQEDQEEEKEEEEEDHQDEQQQQLYNEAPQKRSIYERPPTSYVPESFKQGVKISDSIPLYPEHSYGSYNSHPPHEKAEKHGFQPMSYFDVSNTVGGKQQYFPNYRYPYESLYSKDTVKPVVSQENDSVKGEELNYSSPIPTNSSISSVAPSPLQFSARIDEIINNVTKGVQESEKQQHRDRRKLNEQGITKESNTDSKSKGGYAKIAANKKQFQNHANNKPSKKRTNENNGQEQNHGNAQLTKPLFWQQQDSNKTSNFPYPPPSNNNKKQQKSQYRDHPNKYTNQKPSENHNEVPSYSPVEGQSSTSPINNQQNNGLSTYPPRDQEKSTRMNSGTSGYNTIDGSDAGAVDARSRSKSVPSSDYLAGYHVPDLKSEDYQIRKKKVNRQRLYAENLRKQSKQSKAVKTLVENRNNQTPELIRQDSLEVDSLLIYHSDLNTYQTPNNRNDLLEAIENMKERHEKDKQAIHELKSRFNTSTKTMST